MAAKVVIVSQVLAWRKVWRYQSVIRIRKSKDRKHHGQKKKDKQRSTKHYTKNTKDELNRRRSVDFFKKNRFKCLV